MTNIQKLQTSKDLITLKSTESLPTLTTIITIDNKTGKNSEQLILNKESFPYKLRQIRKENNVNLIKHQKHLEKHVDKESKLISKESSQPIVNFVESSDNNNAEVTKK